MKHPAVTAILERELKAGRDSVQAMETASRELGVSLSLPVLIAAMAEVANSRPINYPRLTR